GGRSAHRATGPAHAPPTRGEEPMSGRRILRGMAATVTGVAVIALAGAGVAAGLVTPAPETSPVPPQEVNVGAAPLTLVCPPAPVVPTATRGQDLDYDAQFGTGGGGRRPRRPGTGGGVSALSSQVAVLRRGGTPADAVGGVVGTDGTSVDAQGNLRLFRSSEAAPVQLVAQPSGQDTALAAGATVARSNTGDLRGL